MINKIAKLLNCNEHFRKNVHLYMETFIQFYGEEYRSEIEEKFSKAMYIAYRSPDSTSIYLHEIAEIKTNELIDLLMNSVETKLKKEDLFTNHNFIYNNISNPVQDFETFYQLHSMTPQERESKYKEELFISLKSLVKDISYEEYELICQTREIPEKYQIFPQWVKDSILYSTDMTKCQEKFLESFEKIKPLLHTINPEITIDNFANYIQDKEIQNLIFISSQIPSTLTEFNNYMQIFEEYKNEDEEISAIEERISDKYYQQFIIENMDLIPENKRQRLEEFLNGSAKSYDLDPYISYLFGYSLHSTLPLEAFSEEADEQLKSNQKWLKDHIKSERIKYFNKNGINLGDNYEDYINNEQVKQIWPNQKRIEQFINSKDKLLNEMNIEYYESLPFYQKTRTEIDQKQLLDKDDSFNPELYTSGTTCVNPNVVKTPKGFELFSLVLINCSNNNGYLDHNIIHELNHLFETTLIKVDENNYTIICGWDILEGQFNQEQVAQPNTVNPDLEKRKYELFNEIINELIAQEICELMHHNKVFIFDSEQKAKYEGATSYEYTMSLVIDFYYKFKDAILESRKNGNIEIIWNEVGKENFDALNDLFDIFNQHFSGFNATNLFYDLREKKDNDQTKLYFELVRKKDKILERMWQYKQEHSSKMSI